MRRASLAEVNRQSSLADTRMTAEKITQMRIRGFDTREEQNVPPLDTELMGSREKNFPTDIGC